jgi:hypothetical protein
LISGVITYIQSKHDSNKEIINWETFYFFFFDRLQRILINFWFVRIIYLPFICIWRNLGVSRKSSTEYQWNK